MAHIPIRVSTLRGDQQINFDAYVKINDKHVLYCRKGDSFEGVRLGRLKEKKLKKMFISDADEENYRKYLEKNIDTAFDAKSGKSVEDRTEILQGTLQSRAEGLIESPGNSALYEDTKKEMLRFVDTLAQEPLVLNRMLAIENIDRNLAQHCVAVSGLATALALKLGIKDTRSTQLIGLGSLMHDMDFATTGFEYSRPVANMTKEDLVKYKEHPMNACRFLQDKKHIDQGVLMIIAQHEETIDGRGFPAGLVEKKIDPLALIVASANKADRLISFEGVKVSDLPREMLKRYMGSHPLEHMKLLGELVKI